MEIFRSMLHGFLTFSQVSLTELCSLWCGLKDLFTLLKLADKVVLERPQMSRKKLWISWPGLDMAPSVKSNDITGGRNDVDPHWRLLAAQKRMG